MYARYIVLKTHLDRTDIGASMVEYSLLVALIAMVSLVAVQIAGDELSQTYSEIHSSLVDASTS